MLPARLLCRWFFHSIELTIAPGIKESFGLRSTRMSERYWNAELLNWVSIYTSVLGAPMQGLSPTAANRVCVPFAEKSPRTNGQTRDCRRFWRPNTIIWFSLFPGSCAQYACSIEKSCFRCCFRRLPLQLRTGQKNMENTFRGFTLFSILSAATLSSILIFMFS